LGRGLRDILFIEEYIRSKGITLDASSGLAVALENGKKILEAVRDGTVCTFTGNFRKAKILKRFSCETSVTLETISVNQVE
jgi:hypothetical protein